MIWLLLVFMAFLLGAYLLYDARRDERAVDSMAEASRNMIRLLDAAEEAQYVGLDAVDSGLLRDVTAHQFMRPPPGAQMVLVGSKVECGFAINMLDLHPSTICVEYEWQLDVDDLDGVRVVMLSSAQDLPAVGAIIGNLRQLSGARFVRLVL